MKISQETSIFFLGISLGVSISIIILGILTVLGLIFFIIVISYFNETRYFSIPFTLLALGSFVIGIILLMVSIILFSISINSKNS